MAVGSGAVVVGGDRTGEGHVSVTSLSPTSGQNTAFLALRYHGLMKIRRTKQCRRSCSDS